MPLPRSITPALFKVARWPAVKGVMLPWADVKVLLASIVNTPVPLTLSPSRKVPSRSKREPLFRLTVSQLL
ncbi:hypothetical protein D3C84_926360 [compost metagenome]